MYHVLIIEADRGRGRQIERSLAEAGFASCQRAGSERQALALAERNFPDLVVVGNAAPGAGPATGTARKLRKIAPLSMLLAAGVASADIKHIGVAAVGALAADAQID